MQSAQELEKKSADKERLTVPRQNCSRNMSVWNVADVFRPEKTPLCVRQIFSDQLKPCNGHPNWKKDLGSYSLLFDFAVFPILFPGLATG